MRRETTDLPDMPMGETLPAHAVNSRTPAYRSATPGWIFLRKARLLLRSLTDGRETGDHGQHLPAAFLAICLTAVLAAPAHAQGVVPAGVGHLQNHLTVPVVVQGGSRVGPAIKRGAPMVIAPGKSLTEFGVPAGVRVYNVYDANQPQKNIVRERAGADLPGSAGRPHHSATSQHADRRRPRVTPWGKLPSLPSASFAAET